MIADSTYTTTLKTHEYLLRQGSNQIHDIDYQKHTPDETPSLYISTTHITHANKRLTFDL